MKRDEVLRAYVTDEEKKKIEEEAKRENRSVSDYLRLRGLGKI